MGLVLPATSTGPAPTALGRLKGGPMRPAKRSKMLGCGYVSLTKLDPTDFASSTLPGISLGWMNVLKNGQAIAPGRLARRARCGSVA